MKAQIPWLRVFVEGVVIVASILLAFGIEAWWGERTDARQEEALLLALASDFETTATLFSQVSAAHTRVTDATARLIEYGLAGSVPEPERAAVDSLVSSLFWRSTFDPPMGTVESVVGSGRLDVLSSGELVTELTQWGSLVSSLRGLETVGLDHFNEQFYPYLSSRINVRDMDKGIPYDVPGGEQRPASAFRLVTDLEFQNIVYMRWNNYMNTVRYLPTVEVAIERIQVLLKEELSR